MAIRTARTRARRAAPPYEASVDAVEETADEERPDPLLRSELGERDLGEPWAEQETAEEDTEDALYVEVEAEPDDEPDEEAELEALVEEQPDLEMEDEDGDEHEARLDELLALQFPAGEWAPEIEAEESDEDAAAQSAPGPEAAAAPAGAQEFVCRSCFLIRDLAQMGDAERRLCKDCLR